MKHYAALSAFALHIWDDLHQVGVELTPETWQSYTDHPSNVLVQYLTHRTTLLAKTELLARLDT